MNIPHPTLRPYVPRADDPFDRVKAAHLLNRAGFGGRDHEIDHVLKLGPKAAVDWLLDFPNASVEHQSPRDMPNLAEVSAYPVRYRDIVEKTRDMSEEQRREYRQQLARANRQAVIEIGRWWLKRMADGPHPLQEKLTFFWHGHFTTSARDERAALLMWRQNELLRRCAAGNFSEFVRAISRDPAMLDYLNNNQNKKAHPNENYARELMELFTLGIGRYTEDDVKEAARAFTGWAHDGAEFVFRANDHDDGVKHFLREEGTFDGEDVIDIILQQPACSRYVAAKLFRYLAYEDVEEPVIDSLGAILRQSRWDLRPLLRTILISRAFYGPRAIGTQIKSPVQLLVGTIRMLEVDFPPAQMALGALDRMGQVPLNPPNVKGWPGGRTWINTSTLFSRYNTAVQLAANAPVDTGDPDPVDYWVQRLIQRPISQDKEQALDRAVTGGDAGSIRRLVQLIVSMPEYQLC